MPSATPLRYSGIRAQKYEELKAVRKYLDKDAFNKAVAKLNREEVTARKVQEKNRKKAQERTENILREAARSKQAATAAKRAEAYLRAETSENPLAGIQVESEVVRPKAPSRIVLQRGKKYNLSGTVERLVEFEGRSGSYTKTRTEDHQISLTPTRNMTIEQAQQAWEKEIPPLMSGTVLSQTVSGFRYDQVGVLQLADVGMGRVGKRYATVSENVEPTKENSCVIDYILSEFSNPDSRMRKYNRTMLEQDFGTGKVSTRQIIEWARCLTPNYVSVCAISPLFEVFDTYQAEDPRVRLVFVVNDEHCFPITDEAIRREAFSRGLMGLWNLRCGRTEICDAVYLEELETDVNAQIVATDKKTVVLNVDRLEKEALQVVSTTGTFIERFSYSSEELVTFQHPITKQVVLAGRDFLERKHICDTLYAETKILDFRFENQGYGTIGSAILKYQHMDIPHSYYSSQLKMIFETYPERAYIMCSISDEERANKAGMASVYARIQSVDIHRAYTSTLAHNDVPFAVFGAFDHIEPVEILSVDDLRPGEYYVQQSFYMGDGTIKVSRGFHPLVLVRYALLNGYIQPADITYGILADRCIAADSFAVFAEDVYKRWGALGKNLVNYTIGCWGSAYHTNTKAGITSSEDIASALQSQYNDAMCHRLGDMIIVQSTERTAKDCGHVPLHRHVIASGLVKLDTLVKDLGLSGHQIVSFNTDSVKFVGDYNTDAVKDKQDCQPGDYHIETKCFIAGHTVEDQREHEVYSHAEHTVETVAEADAKSLLETGGLITGMPGCGKTYLIRHTLWENLTPEQQENTAVVAYTNAGADNLRQSGLPACTFDSLLWTGSRLEKGRLKKYELLILDEFSMLPPDRMSALQHAKKEFGLKVIVVGDSDQCTAPVDNWLKYDTNPLFLEMCGNRVLRMEYKPGYARYDHSLYQAIMRFKTTRSMEGWAPSYVPSYDNLCYTNKTRHKVNAECLTRWLAEQGARPVLFGDRRVAIGLDMLVYHKPQKYHSETKQLVKMERWTIETINKDTISLVNDGLVLKFDEAMFSAIFEYPFCMTTHKAQGRTIAGHFNVFDVEMMSHEVLYTAISRGTTLEHVHLDSVPEGIVRKSSRPLCISVSKAPAETFTARIYRIVTDKGNYYGQTIQDLEARFAEHKAKPTNDMMKDALNDASYIELVEEFKVYSEEQLDKEEIRQIHRAEERGETLLNVQHVRPTVAKRAQAKAKKPTPKKHIGILEDVHKKRYRIKVAHRNVPEDEQVRYFPWLTIGTSKRNALTQAEEWRDYLLKQYFS